LKRFHFKQEHYTIYPEEMEEGIGEKAHKNPLSSIAKTRETLYNIIIMLQEVSPWTFRN
jgi:hypothetical protein